MVDRLHLHRYLSVLPRCFTSAKPRHALDHDFYPSSYFIGSGFLSRYTAQAACTTLHIAVPLNRHIYIFPPEPHTLLKLSLFLIGIIFIRITDLFVGRTAGHIGPAALRADRVVIGHRLADHPAVVPLGLGLLTDHVLVLMAPHGGGRLLRGDVGGGLEGHAGVVRPVLVLALLARLSLALLQGGLGALHAGGPVVLQGLLRSVRRARLLIGTDAHAHGHLRRIGGKAQQASLGGILLVAHRAHRGDGLDGGIGLVYLLGGGHHAGTLGVLELIRALGLGGAVEHRRAIEAVCRIRVVAGKGVDHMDHLMVQK